MTLYVASDNPAYQTLRDKGIDVQSADKAGTNAKHVLLINQMPFDALDDTILGWADLIQKSTKNPDRDVIVTFAEPDGFRAQESAATNRETQTKYPTFSQVRDVKYDGLIVTGANAEKKIEKNLREHHDPFRGVFGWASMKEIFKYAAAENCGCFFSCVSGPMALYHYNGIEPKIAGTKLFGRSKLRAVDQSGNVPSHIQRLVDWLKRQDVFLPTARYFRYEPRMARDAGLRTILKAENGEPALMSTQDGRTMFCAPHPEYRETQIDAEYARDMEAFGRGAQERPQLINYIPGKTGKSLPWQPTGVAAMKSWMDGLDSSKPAPAPPRPSRTAQTPPGNSGDPSGALYI